MTARHDPIEQTAAIWLQRTQAGLDGAGARELRAWLAADARHRDAFQATSRIWSMLGTLVDDPELASERERARIRLVPRAPAARPRRLSVAAGVAASVGLMLTPIVLPLPAAAYSTAHGEQLTVPLRGGGSLDLNGSTRIIVAGTWLRPHVRMMEGEMLVKGGSTLRAVRVSVNSVVLDVGSASVSVRDARHATYIRPAAGRISAELNGRPLPYLYGNRLQIIEADGRMRLVDDRAGKALAWRAGRIILDQSSVADAIAEFARYRTTRVTVEPEVARLSVSGIYRTTDLEAFLDALSKIHPVRWSRDQAGIRIEPA